MARSRSPRNPGSRLVIVLVFLAASYLLRSCKKTVTPVRNSPRPTRTSHAPSMPSMPSVPSGASSSEGNLLLGNPTSAGSDENNFLLERPQYSMSYNHSRGGSNWVAWHTDASDLGTQERGKFRPDPDLPKSWQITPGDYTGSGYDRGHVCPSGDRTSNREDNDATFCMSNMLPQAAEVNQHVWKDLEDQGRDWVQSGMEIYQIAGGAGEKERVGRRHIVVPQFCWKVMVILPLGTGDLGRMNSAKVVAVWMPNEKTDALKNGDWKSFRTTPAQIEKATGLRFFSALPKNVASALEGRSDQF